MKTNNQTIDTNYEKRRHGVTLPKQRVNCEMIFTFEDCEQMFGYEDLDLSSERATRRGIRAYLRKHRIKGDLMKVSMCTMTKVEDLEKTYNWYFQCNGKLWFGMWELQCE
jgi:hypothetical protein